MFEVFSSRGASLHQLNSLAEWIRENVARVKDGKLDVISFVELDLPKFFPGVYLEIEEDRRMGSKKAYISDQPLGIVVAESVYNRACDGHLDACETILHEVGHIFLHQKYKSIGLNDAYGKYKEQIRDTNPSNSAEWQAKAFAMCLLFPYSTSKKYQSRIEFQVIFDLSVEQSEKVLTHLRKLRLRERERCLKGEATWVKSVLSSLPQARKLDNHVSTSIQSDLFYRKTEHIHG